MNDDKAIAETGNDAKPDDAANKQAPIKQSPTSVPNAEPTKTHLSAALKHDRPTISCRFDPSGNYVFFGAQDFHVWRWRLSDNQKTQFSGHDSWVRGIAFTSDGETMISGGYDGRLIWWPVNADKPQPIRTVEAHDGWIRAVAVSPDNTLVATAGNDNLVKLWKCDDGSPVRELAGHERHVYNVAFHPDGKHLVSGDLMAKLIDWEIDSGKQRRQLEAKTLTKFDPKFRADIGGFRGLCFSNDGKYLAGSGITNVSNAFAGIGNPAVALLDWEPGKEKMVHLSKAKLRGCGWGVALHPDGFTVGLSGGGGGGHLLFWKPDQKEEFHTLKLPNTARDLHLAADGIRLATAHADGHVRIAKMIAKA